MDNILEDEQLERLKPILHKVLQSFCDIISQHGETDEDKLKLSALAANQIFMDTVMFLSQGDAECARQACDKVKSTILDVIVAREAGN